MPASAYSSRSIVRSVRSEPSDTTSTARTTSDARNPTLAFAPLEPCSGDDREVRAPDRARTGRDDELQIDVDVREHVEADGWPGLQPAAQPEDAALVPGDRLAAIARLPSWSS